MMHTFRTVSVLVCSFFAFLAGFWALSPSTASAASPAASVVEEGKKVAFNRKKGNCLACHRIAGGMSPGTIGPPLVVMKQRFPEKARLRAQIRDATRFNPDSPMPPFGRHDILTEGEIDKVVEFVYAL